MAFDHVFFCLLPKILVKKLQNYFQGEILLGDDLVFELAFIEYRLLYSEPEGGVCRSKRSGSLDWT
jgi:predicted AAA+ superfamily ATPase